MPCLARAFVWMDFSIRRILMQWMRNSEFGCVFLYLPVMVHQVIFDLKIQKDNPKDDSLIEEILLQIFDQEHSIIRDEGPAPASLKGDPKKLFVYEVMK